VLRDGAIDADVLVAVLITAHTGAGVSAKAVPDPVIHVHSSDKGVTAA
jgi:hypothetical protein